MAVAESLPASGERMIAILGVQPFFGNQFVDDGAELADIFVLLLDLFIVSLELAGINDLQLSSSSKSSSTLPTS